MTDDNRKPVDADRGGGRWAPWWAYLIPILGVNYLRQLVLPYGTVPEVVDVLFAVLIAAVLFVLITVGYRASRR